MNSLKKYYDKYGEILRYLIVGGLTTVVSLGSYYLCTTTFLDPGNKVQLQLANIISWICAVTFAYITNKLFVFKCKKSSFKECVSFYTSRLTTLGIDIVIMYVFVSLLSFNDKIVKLAIQVIVTILNYVLSKIFVFKKEK